MNDLLKINNILIVFEFLQDGDFSDGSAWDPIVQVVDLDVLNGDHLVAVKHLGLVDDTVGSLTKDFGVDKGVFELLGCLSCDLFLGRSR